GFKVSVILKVSTRSHRRRRSADLRKSMGDPLRNFFDRSKGLKSADVSVKSALINMSRTRSTERNSPKAREVSPTKATVGNDEMRKKNAEISFSSTPTCRLSRTPLCSNGDHLTRLAHTLWRQATGAAADLKNRLARISGLASTDERH